MSRFTAGSSGRSVIAWLLADGIVVHCAMIAALFARLIWQLQGADASPSAHIAELMKCYLERMLPLSLVFPLLFLVSRCYAGSTCRDWTRSAVSLLRASFVAAVLYSAACALGGKLGALDVSTGALFLGLTLSGTLASRWVRSLANSPHTTESVPAYVRGARSEDAPVLVVGGAGYIGSILVRRLIASGRKVRVLDSLAYGNSALRSMFGHPSMELQAGDCRNLKSVVSAVDGVDTVIHLAAIVGDPACEQEREAALETNYAATRMLIEVARGAKVRRLIFASTCSVYGASDELVEETSQPNPISLYAQTKVQS
ncbi:MAG TPA: NAD-dependent epimerase/dehydratase family protein, partial [Bryobacteraceae bacterium]|nr:NAD-dependent epimerase/dehydratase family protein [Bryobacteraceae bacterium]